METTNYIKEYYKSAEHDLSSLLNADTSSEEVIAKIRREIVKMQKEVELKSVELHNELEKAYSKSFEPLPNKIIIRYDDISSVFQNTYNLRYSRKKARKTFIAGDYQDYVELTLKGGKQFCFSVENQKEFIEELKKRRNKDSTDE